MTTAAPQAMTDSDAPASKNPKIPAWLRDPKNLLVMLLIGGNVGGFGQMLSQVLGVVPAPERTSLEKSVQSLEKTAAAIDAKLETKFAVVENQLTNVTVTQKQNFDIVTTAQRENKLETLARIDNVVTDITSKSKDANAVHTDHEKRIIQLEAGRAPRP